jgi:hypothetical protein
MIYLQQSIALKQKKVEIDKKTKTKIKKQKTTLFFSHHFCISNAIKSSHLYKS